MQDLNESIVWDCYHFIFSNEESDKAGDILADFSKNPQTQSLFFKFKMRAQSERIRLLERNQAMML
jgi:hypothetical protein